MKKVFAIILIVGGGVSMFQQVAASGGDGSKMGAAVGVCLIAIILGIKLWSKCPPEPGR